MKQKSEATFEFNQTEYTVTLIPQQGQKMGYSTDLTVFQPEPLLSINQLILPVGEHQTKNNILLIGASFITILHYAAALKKQYPSIALNLVVMDLSIFVVDCWDVFKKLLFACNNKPDILNSEVTKLFAKFLRVKVDKRLMEYGYPPYDSPDVRFRDTHDFFSQPSMLEMNQSMLQLFDTYDVKMISEIVTNAVVFCGNLGLNANLLSSLINNNPQSFSLFYASNAVEMMHANFFKIMLTASPDLQSYLNDILTQLHDPVYDLSIHLYTRRSDQELKSDARYRVDQTRPNKILVAWGNSNDNIKRIFKKQLDVLFFQTFYPGYPTQENITNRPRELYDVCSLRDNEITQLNVSDPSSFSQNRHTYFSTQAASSAAATDPMLFPK